MKIAVIGANGKAGKLIVKEAIKRNHDVTAVVRSENKSEASKVINKDLFELSKVDLADFDVVVSAFGTFNPDTLSLHSKTVEHFSEILDGTNTHLLIVGGAGSLFLDKSKTTKLFELPEFPEIFIPLAKAQADELDLLRTKENINWTFVSPAVDFVEDGPKTNNYGIAGKIFTTNEEGVSYVSYADYASALLDIIEANSNIKERVSVYTR